MFWILYTFLLLVPLQQLNNFFVGAISSDYWDSSSSIQQNSTDSRISPAPFPKSMQRQVTHMIPTGFRHQHTLRANPEYLNEVGHFNGDSNAEVQVQQNQQKPFFINQSTYPVQQPSNHVDSGVHSGMLENPLSHDLSDPQIRGGMELHGSNMLLTDRYSASEAFINLPPYCSYPDKALKQEVNLQSMGSIYILYF